MDKTESLCWELSSRLGRHNNQVYNMLGIKKCSNGNKSKSRDGASFFGQRILSEEVMFDWRPE